MKGKEKLANHKNIKWTIPKKKLLKDIHETGDIIFVKKKIIIWYLKK